MGVVGNLWVGVLGLKLLYTFLYDSLIKYIEIHDDHQSKLNRILYFLSGISFYILHKNTITEYSNLSKNPVQLPKQQNIPFQKVQECRVPILKLLMRKFADIHKHPNAKKPQPGPQPNKHPNLPYYLPPTRSPTISTLQPQRSQRLISTTVNFSYINNSNHDSHLHIQSPRPADNRSLSRTVSQNMLTTKAKFSGHFQESRNYVNRTLGCCSPERVLMPIENEIRPKFLTEIQGKSIISIDDSQNEPANLERRQSIIDAFYQYFN